VFCFPGSGTGATEEVQRVRFVQCGNRDHPRDLLIGKRGGFFLGWLGGVLPTVEPEFQRERQPAITEENHHAVELVAGGAVRSIGLFISPTSTKVAKKRFHCEVREQD
jgi:hypothetical protein